MILFILETLEWFAKREVADQVEGSERVPFVEVDCFWHVGDLLVQLLDQEVGVVVQDRLLLV